MTAKQKTPLAGGADGTAFDGKIIAEIPKSGMKSGNRGLSTPFKSGRVAANPRQC